MKRIALMANDLPGLEIAKFLARSNDSIELLYLHDENKRRYGDEIVLASNCKNIYEAKELKNPIHLDIFKNANIDFIITVYWAYLLKPQLFNLAKDSVNFHPAFLPINRGWYPHVHSIVDGSKLGVTLHRIDEGADTGPIWVQKEMRLLPHDTSKTIYDRQRKEIIKLFKKNWNKIKNNELKPFQQNESKAIYRKKTDINKFDRINLEDKISVKKLINILRARSFGDLGFAYYEEDGETIYLNLRLSKDINFN